MFELLRDIWILNGIAFGLFVFFVLCLGVAYVILTPFTSPTTKCKKRHE